MTRWVEKSWLKIWLKFGTKLAELKFYPNFWVKFRPKLMISLLWPKLMISLLWSFDQLTQIFGSKWLNFFASCTERKKMNHFDLKNWITSGTKIWPKKFNHWQNKNLTQIFKSKWLNFFASCTERKISHFDLKKFKHWQNGNLTQIFGSKWLNFFAHCTERKNESFWPKKLSYWRKNLDPNF